MGRTNNNVIYLFIFAVVVFVALDITGNIPWSKIGPGKYWWGIEQYVIILMILAAVAWFVFWLLRRAFNWKF